MLVTKKNLAVITVNNIHQALRGPLPGVPGQLRMAPEPISESANRWDKPDDCREASVLLLFYPMIDQNKRSDFYFVLTRRPEYPGVHGGQISLPGGRREKGEALVDTALRETNEEIGVVPESLKVIGQLSSLYIPPSNFCIYPFVAFCSTRPSFIPDAVEVAEIIETPLSLLLDPAIQKSEMWHFETYGTRQIPFFEILGHKVWGATAMILSEFLTLLEEKILSTN